MEVLVMKNEKSFFTVVGAVILASFFILAVMGTFSNSYAKGEHGSMKYNSAIITKFGSSVKIPENLDVYFYGPADRPDAVIGIIKGTPFDSETWRPIAQEAEEIGKWRYLIENNNDLLSNPYWGYDLYDPDGKLFGKWISYDRRTVIKMTKDNKIAVYPPDASLRMDRRSGPF
jgi:hypothetical protein